MKKLIKLLIWATAILLLLVVIAGVVLYMNLNSIVKKGVETYGPEITQTSVGLEESDISLFSGSGELTGIFIGNPSGFLSPSAVEVERLDVNVDTWSLFSDTAVVNELVVVSPHITYEFNERRDNLNTLKDNVDESMAQREAERPAQEAEPEGPGQQVVIKDLYILNASVTAAWTDIEPRSMTIPLPDLHLTNIGMDENGMDPAQVFSQVWDALLASITDVAGSSVADLQNLAEQGIYAVQEGAGEVLDQGQGLVEDGASAVEDGAGAVGDTVEDGAGSIQEGVEDLGQGLQNMF